MIILFIFNDQFAYEYRISNRIVEMSVHTHLHTYHFNIKKKKKFLFFQNIMKIKMEKKIELKFNQQFNSCVSLFFLFSLHSLMIKNDEQKDFSIVYIYCADVNHYGQPRSSSSSSSFYYINLK